MHAGDALLILLHVFFLAQVAVFQWFDRKTIRRSKPHESGVRNRVISNVFYIRCYLLHWSLLFVLFFFYFFTVASLTWFPSNFPGTQALTWLTSFLIITKMTWCVLIHLLVLLRHPNRLNQVYMQFLTPSVGKYILPKIQLKGWIHQKIRNSVIICSCQSEMGRRRENIVGVSQLNNFAACNQTTQADDNNPKTLCIAPYSLSGIIQVSGSMKMCYFHPFLEHKLSL